MGMHCIRFDGTGLLCSRRSKGLLPQRVGLQHGAGYVWAAAVHMKLGTSALQREEGCSIGWDLKRWIGNRNGVCLGWLGMAVSEKGQNGACCSTTQVAGLGHGPSLRKGTRRHR
jgi:hypothetical protein